MDIAFPYNAEMPDDFDGNVPEFLVFMVIECLAGRYNNGFPCMNAKGIKIFHVADRNAVVF